MLLNGVIQGDLGTLTEEATSPTSLNGTILAKRKIAWETSPNCDFLESHSIILTLNEAEYFYPNHSLIILDWQQRQYTDNLDEDATGWGLYVRPR